MDNIDNLNDATESFCKKNKCFKGGTITLQGNPEKEIDVNPDKIRCAEKSILGNPYLVNELLNEMNDHFNLLLEYLKICSTPSGFTEAWNCENDTLTLQQAQLIKGLGGNIFPQDDRLKFCMLCNAQGVTLSDNKNLTFALKRSNSEFNDELDPKTGIINYYPPQNLTGALRFKWMQELCSFEIPIVVLVVKWFKCNLHPSPKSHENHLFCIAPAKIVNYEEDIKDYAKSISNPLSLQLLDPLDAETLIKSVQGTSKNTIHQLKLPLDSSLDFPLE